MSYDLIPRGTVDESYDMEASGELSEFNESDTNAAQNQTDGVDDNHYNNHTLHSVIGCAFDVVSIVISLLDLGTDIYILIKWYLDKEMIFFWIGMSILILAQSSYVIMFYLYHPPNGVIGLVLTLLCTLWCIPFYSLLFFFASDESSILRKWKYLNWNSYENSSNRSPLLQMLERKIYKNIGFILEALIEALPMSLLQLSYIALRREVSIISIASILISMLSVCSKLFLMMSPIGDSRSWTTKILMWFSFVVDFIGIFFVVSFVSTDFREIIFWDCVFGVAPCSICLAIIFPFAIQVDAGMQSCIFQLLSFPLLFMICLLAAALSMSIMDAAWFALLSFNHGSAQRLWFTRYSSWEDGRNFYQRVYQWVLNGPQDVIDVEVNEILIPKHRDRILRVCTINKLLMDSAKSSGDPIFRQFLEDQSSNNFMSVKWSDIRNHHTETLFDDQNDHMQIHRNAKFGRVLFYNFYASIYYAARAAFAETGLFMDKIVFWCTIPMTFIFGPLYLTSRMFRFALPIIIPLILGINQWDLFQVVMWSSYLFVFVIWLLGMYNVGRKEFYLWHILPSFLVLEEFKISKGFDTLSTEIVATHHNITMEPVVRGMLIRRYGVDLSIIILMYLY